MDANSNFNWRVKNGLKRLEKRAGRGGNWRTSHPNYNIVRIGQNTKKNPEDLR